MKVAILLLLTLGPSLSLRAQLQNISVSDQFSISKIYAGINSVTFFPTDSISSYAAVNFRAGMQSRFVMTNKLMLKSWAAVHLEKGQPIAGYNSFEILVRPVKPLSLHVGLIATPVTILRPNPTTWESQVETHTQSTIISGRPGTKISYLLSSRSAITYGLFNHGNLWAQHLSLSLMNWKLAGYLTKNNTSFLALKYKSKKLESITSWAFGESYNTALLFSIHDDVTGFVDVQYQIQTASLSFLQTGVRHQLAAPHLFLNGFMGITYDWYSHTVLGQLFIHLFKG